MKIVIGIPAHGWSAALAETIGAIRSSSDPRVRGATVLITNSGRAFPRNNYDGIEEIAVSIDCYWTGAVARLYREAAVRSAEWIVLLNHDCHPAPTCLGRLLDFCLSDRGRIAHAVLVYKDRPDRIWWAGSLQRWGTTFAHPYADQLLTDLPSFGFQVSSTMGQCLVMPSAAARPEFLHERQLPHYFSDSVQTCEMRRAGYTLHVVPDAIAYTDQSDLERKRKRIRADSFPGIWRSWTAPYSSRNLRATAWAAWWHQDHVSGGLVLLIKMTLGRLLKPILEYARLIRHF